MKKRLESSGRTHSTPNKQSPTAADAASNPRLAAIVERMKIRESDRVLEIGCGHGVAATLICDRLTTGHLVAIDRSTKMIRAAEDRNAVHIERGVAEFHVTDFADFDPGPLRFDKILAVRVGDFQRRPEWARTHVKRWLAPRGKLVIVYDEPPIANSPLKNLPGNLRL
jgi:cyclopropane fatty-acyl-phospholipid synthase-like methyltransferase